MPQFEYTVYSQFNTPVDDGIDCSGDPIYTQQSFAEEADINFIMARYERTGVLVDPTKVSMREASFGDFSEGLDYMETQNRLLAGQAAFASLPAKVRERFRNDPAELVEFVSDEANRAEAVSLGLVAPPEAPRVPEKPVAAVKPVPGEKPVSGTVVEPPA